MKILFKNRIKFHLLMSTNTQLQKNKQIKEDQNLPNKTKKMRDPFTPQEDEKLKKLVSIFGTKNWRIVAASLLGRTPKQCRDRYTNYLVPGFFKGEWSKDEDLLLAQTFSAYGPKWSILKNFFPHRSCNSIKNRWTYFLSKQYIGIEFEYQKQKVIKDNKTENANLNKTTITEKDDLNDAVHEVNTIEKDFTIQLNLQNEDENNIHQNEFEYLYQAENSDIFDCFDKKLVEFDFDWMY